MKRLLIITDSLGAPRTVPELVSYDQTWTKMVKEHAQRQGFDVSAHTINGLDTRELLKLVNEKLCLYEPDIVLFQYGIVDCAPRVFSDREKLIFRIFHLHKLAAKIGKKYHAALSAKRDVTAVSLSEFDGFVGQINDKLRAGLSKPLKVVNIPIGSACQGYVDISPTIKQKIASYNEVIKHHADVFLADFVSAPVEQIYTKDRHHLNPFGHKLLADIVIDGLKKLY